MVDLFGLFADIICFCFSRVHRGRNIGLGLGQHVIGSHLIFNYMHAFISLHFHLGLCVRTLFLLDCCFLDALLLSLCFTALLFLLDIMHLPWKGVTLQDAVSSPC